MRLSLPSTQGSDERPAMAHAEPRIQILRRLISAPFGLSKV